MACGLTHIRRGIASTLKEINNTRSQVLGNFILKREKRSEKEASGGAENESSIEMKKKAIDLSADLERMYSYEWKAELGTVWTEGFGSKVLSKNLRVMRSNM